MKSQKSIEEESKIFFERYMQRIKESKVKVSDKSYIEWLYDFLNRHPILKETGFSDDEFKYYQNSNVYTSKDLENINLLSYFHDYIEEKANEFNIVFEDNDSDESICFFKYRDEFYKIETINGQGSLTILSMCTEIPLYYVNFDEENTKQEYVQYIVVNKDLEMSDEQMAVEVGHACTLCAVAEKDLNIFKKWMEDGQKKVILKLHQKDLEKLKRYHFHFVYYLDLIEKSQNCLTAISLGILRKEDIERYVNNKN